jgi:hypothetical protein
MKECRIVAEIYLKLPIYTKRREKNRKFVQTGCSLQNLIKGICLAVLQPFLMSAAVLRREIILQFLKENLFLQLIS